MTIIITLCILLLLAYVFDLTSAKTKIPSVILLLLLGWLVRHLSGLFGIQIPRLDPLLPVLGTVGLILIVMEGSLDLEINSSKQRLIRQSFIVSFLPMMALAFLLAALLHYLVQAPFKHCLINAIPLCVISSAIAIPTVKSHSQQTREFVVYESSLSDILGVLFFNFVALNSSFGLLTVGNFIFQLLLILLISFAATIGLSILLNKIDHHIKFVPIIILVILIYMVSKYYHLPALLFILLFGMFLGNTDGLKHLRWMEKLNPDNLKREVHKLKEMGVEGAFIIRALFFILFGYLIETAEITNPDTLLWAVAIVAAILIIRAVQLTASGLTLLPLLFIAPRGLITILLFLAIDPSQHIAMINNSLIIQVILLSALLMMLGLMLSSAVNKKHESIEVQPNH